MSHCIKCKSFKRSRTRNYINKNLEKYWYKNLEPVPEVLKKYIFEQLKNASSISDIRVSKQLFAYTGDDDEAKKCILNLAHSMEVGFDETILLWHIATDPCHYSDRENESETVKNLICMSKLLSNYLVYLLVMCPYMLPGGIGEIRFRDTCAEAIEFIEEREYISDVNKACEMLFKVNMEIPQCQIKGDRSKSVLFDARILAQSLQFLETPKNLETKPKWDTE